MRIDFIFYAIAIVCFIGFLACLAWYYMEKRKPKNTKTPLNWTIESARKFLEENDKNNKQTENQSKKVVILDKEKFTETKTDAKVEKTQETSVKKQNVKTTTKNNEK